MIYLPEVGEYACYVVLNKDTIRAYKTLPTINTTLDYRDYFINSHYIHNDHYEIITDETQIPSCIPQEQLTTAAIYRNDIAHILVIALILIGVTWFFVSSLIKTLFKGRKVF